MTRREAPRGGVELPIQWPWWLNPILLALVVGGGSALYAFTRTASDFESWRTPKYLSDADLLPVLTCLAALVLGLAIHSGAAGKRSSTMRLDDRTLTQLTAVYRVLLGLTFAGYAVWFGVAVIGGVRVGDLLAVLQRDPGAISQLKARARPVSGVTTVTQFGPMAAVLGYVLWKIGRVRPVFWALLFLAAIRTMFYAERLATIEVVIPLAVAWVVLAKPGPRLKLVIALFPLWAGVAILFLFGLSEYFRSWIFYSQTADTDFVSWILARLGGYYATAYNNSALLVSKLPAAGVMPYFSLAGVWAFPGVSSLVGSPEYGGLPVDDWWDSVLMFANPELNNTGSFLVTTGELGFFAIPYWLLIGLMVGRAYWTARGGSLAGLLSYSVLLIGLLEVPRILYFTQGRALPVLLSVVLVASVSAARAVRRTAQREGRS